MASTPTPSSTAYGSDDEVADNAAPHHQHPPPPPLSPQLLRFSDGAAGSGAGVLSAGSSSPAAIAQLPSTPPSQPALTPFEAMCPPSDAALADYRQVTHSFGTVAGQLAHGLDALRAVAEFVRRVCAAKNAYASELLKTAAAASSVGIANGAAAGGGAPGSKGSGSGDSGDSDAMAGASRLWGELKEQLFDDARQEQEIGTKLAAEVVAPMLSFHAEAQRKSKIVLAHQQALAGQMRALTEGQLLQAKIVAVRAVTALQVAEAREREAAQAARLANPDVLAPIPPPPVHTKMADLLDHSHSAGAAMAAGAGTKGASSSASKVEASTRRALASVGSFFKSLGKKDSNAGAGAPGTGVGGAAAGGSAAGGAASDPSGPASSGSGAALAGPDAPAPSSSSSSALAIAAAASSSSSSSSSMAGDSEDLRERAYQAALSYQLAVASSNARQEQYFRSDLPQLFAELQRLEVARLNCLRHYVSLLAAASLSLCGPTQQRLESLLASARSIDPPGETRRFAGEIVSKVGEAQQPNPFVYDLAFRPEAIRGAKMDAALPSAAAAAAAANESARSPSAVSCFTSSLSAQMDLTDAQHDAQGGELLDVPRTLHVLVEAIRARKGFHRGGLFSTAAPAEEVAALRAAFESGDFDCSRWSLEALAGALKAWLRGLPEPLLSAPLYSAAIQAVKKDAAAANLERHQRAEAAALAAAKPSPSSSNNDPHAVQSLDGVDRPANQSAAAAAVSPSTGAAAAAAISADRPRSASLSGGAGSGLSLPPATAQSALPSAQLQQYAQSINAALPTLNQRVLGVLAALLSDMAAAGAQVQLTSTAAAAQSLSPRAGAQSGAADDCQTDWNRWAAAMSHSSAIFASAIMRNAQADTTELLSHCRHELRFCAALLITIAQAAMQRAQPPLSPPLSPPRAAATAPSSSAVAADVPVATASPAASPVAALTSPHAASPSPHSADLRVDAAALDHEPPPLVTATSDSSQ